MLLLDTNIVSFQFRRDTRATLFQAALAGEVQAIAFVTLAELYKWPIERSFSPERRAALENLLHSYVVLPFDDALARRWAELSVQLKRAGRGIGDSDAWIAATALRHGLSLVTHNRAHFNGIPGLTIISESGRENA
jgi:predicted nucleic acid-binding protein